MKLRFAPRAIANLVDIADYFHERNPVAGRRVRSDIYAALAGHPFVSWSWPQAERRACPQICDSQVRLSCLLHD